MRGKGFLSILIASCHRITPACAGKSDADAAQVKCWQDHPRLCGEKFSAGSATLPSRGSPPLVRGKDGSLNYYYLRQRITPACAGKRRYKYLTSPNTKDHPRLCGEKRWAGEMWHPVSGSPPLVRGKDASATVHAYRPRITPACAGKSELRHRRGIYR